VATIIHAVSAALMAGFRGHGRRRNGRRKRESAALLLANDGAPGIPPACFVSGSRLRGAAQNQ
jgi:hypothetical protein